jgi:hypothetical protein
MFFRSLLVLLPASLAVISTPVAVTEELDWKYAVNWDGVVSPASAFGTSNATTEVRYDAASVPPV